MNLHGWILSVTPGEAQEIEAGGFCNVAWQMYETSPEGVEAVETQLPKEWKYDIVTFGFSDDMVDYTHLHGLVAFRRLNPPQGEQYGPIRLGKHILDTTFVLCGYIDGQAVPLHSQEQSAEVIAWFISKQVQWHGAYSQREDRTDAEQADAAKAGISPWPSQRSSRPTVH